jgi:hypothetical protein
VFALAKRPFTCVCFRRTSFDITDFPKKPEVSTTHPPPTYIYTHTQHTKCINKKRKGRKEEKEEQLEILFFWGGGFETGFLCISLAVLELTL